MSVGQIDYVLLKHTVVRNIYDLSPRGQANFTLEIRSTGKDECRRRKFLALSTPSIRSKVSYIKFAIIATVCWQINYSKVYKQDQIWHEENQ